MACRGQLAGGASSSRPLRFSLPANRAGHAMRRAIDRAIYTATAPIRLFGRSRRFRLALGAACVIALFFAATLWALDRLLPAESDAKQAVAKLSQLPPLPP